MRLGLVKIGDDTWKTSMDFSECRLSRVDLYLISVCISYCLFSFYFSCLNKLICSLQCFTSSLAYTDTDALSLSAFPSNLQGNYVFGCFSTPFYNIFGSRFPCILQQPQSFSAKHIFVGFNEFTSFVCWCTVIHHHQPHGSILFLKVRWDFTCVQGDVCIYTVPPVLSPIRED